MRKGVISVLCCLGIGLGIVGCSGDGGDTVAKEETYTQEDLSDYDGPFIVCTAREYEDEMDKYLNDGGYAAPGVKEYPHLRTTTNLQKVEEEIPADFRDNCSAIFDQVVDDEDFKPEEVSAEQAMEETGYEGYGPVGYLYARCALTDPWLGMEQSTVDAENGEADLAAWREARQAQLALEYICPDDSSAVNSDRVDAIVANNEPAQKKYVEEQKKTKSPGSNLILECSDDYMSDDKREVNTLKEVWKLPAEQHQACMLSFGIESDEWELTSLEKKALKTAYGDDAKEESIEHLYSSCAETNFGYEDGEVQWSEGIIKEYKGSKTLCPKHPDVAKVDALVSAAQQADKDREAGIRFYNGTYRVGEDIKPGTYVTESDDEPLEGCYWERTNAAGDIIANNFLSSGFRAEMTVAPTDYSVTSNSCNEWVRK